jgi:hypothetical protein
MGVSRAGALGLWVLSAFSFDSGTLAVRSGFFFVKLKSKNNIQFGERVWAWALSASLPVHRIASHRQ